MSKCEGDVSLNCRCRRMSLLVACACLFFLRNCSLVVVTHKNSRVLGTAPAVVEEGQPVAVAVAVEQGLAVDNSSDEDHSHPVPEPLRIRSTKRQPTSHQQQQKPQQDSDPNLPASLASNATVSACLLIKDDNDILPEWLAYHYHTINMRDIIVAVDPTSTESPSAILQKWRQNTNLNVREWTDDSYMPEEFLKTGTTPLSERQIKDMSPQADDEAKRLVANHRYRQRVFLTRCMKSFRQQGLSWVIQCVFVCDGVIQCVCVCDGVIQCV